MGTTHTSAQVVPAMSTTGIRKRTVSDSIRKLFPGNPFITMVSSGVASKDGTPVREKNMIGKKRVDGSKFEAFTYSPHAVLFTVAAGGGGTTSVTVTAATGLRPTYTVVNTNNKTVARISAISTNDLTLLAVDTANAFSAAAGDKLLVMGPAYGENSSSPYILQKDPDNMYNYTQIMRFPVAISNTSMNNPYHGGERWKHYKEENVIEGYRKVSNALLFSQRGQTETVADGTLSDSPRFMRGVWNWAQTTYSAGGNMTFDKWLQELPLNFHSSVSSQDKKVLLCGTRFYGQILGWINEGLITRQNDKGSYSVFGVKTDTVLSAKGSIEICVIDQFDQGDFEKTALIINPERLSYCHLRDRDIKANTDIQDNDVDGKIDELIGEISIVPDDAGYSIMTVTDLYN